MHLDLKLD